MITKATPNTLRPPFTQSARRTVQAAHQAVVTNLSHDDIARLAYTIYLRSGMRVDCCKQNWNQAEYELRRQRIRHALMSEMQTPLSGDEKYSEVLNGRNPRGDVKLMLAIAADTQD